jgi:hypothetical protein
MRIDFWTRMFILDSLMDSNNKCFDPHIDAHTTPSHTFHRFQLHSRIAWELQMARSCPFASCPTCPKRSWYECNLLGLLSYLFASCPTCTTRSWYENNLLIPLSYPFALCPTCLTRSLWYERNLLSPQLVLEM